MISVAFQCNNAQGFCRGRFQDVYLVDDDGRTLALEGPQLVVRYGVGSISVGSVDYPTFGTCERWIHNVMWDGVRMTSECARVLVATLLQQGYSAADSTDGLFSDLVG